MLLATGHGAKGLVVLTVNVVALTFTGARYETIRVVRVDGQRKQREAFTGAGKFLEFLPGFIQNGIVVKAPVIAVSRIGDGGFQLFGTIQVIETVGFQEHIFPGKAQVSALHKVVFIARVFQDITKANVLREEARHRGGGVTFKRSEQRNAALGGHHPGDGVIRAG